MAIESRLFEPQHGDTWTGACNTLENHVPATSVVPFHHVPGFREGD